MRDQDSQWQYEKNFLINVGAIVEDRKRGIYKTHIVVHIVIFTFTYLFPAVNANIICWSRID